MSMNLSPEQIFFLALGAMFVTGLVSTVGMFIWTLAKEMR